MYYTIIKYHLFLVTLKYPVCYLIFYSYQLLFIMIFIITIIIIIISIIIISIIIIFIIIIISIIFSVAMFPTSDFVLLFIPLVIQLPTYFVYWFLNIIIHQSFNYSTKSIS